MASRLTIITIGLLALSVTACSKQDQSNPSVLPAASVSTPAAPAVAAVDAARLVAADSEPGSWMSYGRTYSEQRYSPLTAINASNIDTLGLAWSYELNTKRGIEATSIVVDGVMYTSSAWSIVHALDARTGAHLWSFDPKVAKDKSLHTCCDVVNRGVAVWQGRVFVGVLDGRLIALDAATGKLVWEVATVDSSLPYSITGAPRVVKGKVLIGNGGAEFGVRGFISAYNVADGSMAWRFYTVPGNPEHGFENETMAMAADTWNGTWWEMGGGGTVWDAMAYDPELDLLYIGVGNGSPWNHRLRSPGGGDNLFLSSIVALRPDSGEYVWHYQTTPGETWDYTATQHIILADLELDGKTRKVLMQAPKNGFFYVLDRTDGTLLSANNYINITWATHVDMATGRPAEVREARFYDDKPYLVFPSYLGGHNWHPMSYSPDTGLVYIPVLDIPANFGGAKNFTYRPGLTNLGIDGIIAGLPDAQAERDALRPLVAGRLVAWNPVTQQEEWRVEHRGSWNGGLLSTASNLVFQGTADGKLVAYSADKGGKVWEFPVATGIVAPPISYEIDGEQYISINVGWGGAFALVFGEFVQPESLPNVNRTLTFKLGASGTLSMPQWQPRINFDPPPQTADADTLDRGHLLYQDICLGCHGLNAVSGLLIPDLRGSPWLHQPEGWNSVVMEGALRKNGMAAFKGLISEQESLAIRAYVIQQSRRALELQQAKSSTPKVERK
ncbi:MAG: PQQ-dependent dehydrogenase, methanol/ethanol family [Gammaproteobacteria bacterium]|nr:PQQ-dependent dehydrogenase, methanol/ethanol family [Gammaproteobacteria bacterium]